MISDSQFQRIKELLVIIMWPLIIFFGALFFNKVFTYLFFSVRKFNFFGMEGKLRNIEDVINEQVENRLQEKKDKEEKEKLFQNLEVTAQQKEVIGETLGYYEKRISDSEKENAELRRYFSEQRNKVVHGCDLQHLDRCDSAGLMKLIAELLADGSNKNK